MIDEHAINIASQCRHYAMCKIDYLGTGLCPAAENQHYVSFFPQGKLGIYYALSQNRIPITLRIVEIAESCNLCGICDKQCYFVTGLKPSAVMKALKAYVENYLNSGGSVIEPEKDEILLELCAITGEKWSSNDLADLAAYGEDPAPVSDFTIPSYVTLPKSSEEIADILNLCLKHNLPWVVRGNGSSVMGLVLSTGVIIDLHRMNTIRFDPDNWSVTIGPGVAAFELQQEAYKRGFRVNTAEASALLCANVMCSGIFSLFSASFGVMADNVIDAQFVSENGSIFRLNDRTGPNLYSFTRRDMPVSGICTELTARLHPLLDDESGVLVPFEKLSEGLSFARDLSMRRIGTAIGILGPEYISSFLSPTEEMDRKFHSFLKDILNLGCLVLVIGTAHDLAYVYNQTKTVIDNEQFSAFMLGLPRLLNDEISDLLKSYQGSKPVFDFLFCKEMFPIIEAILNPSSESYAATVDDDLKEFFTSLYRRPELTDLVWLNSFRILSPRLGRKKHVVAYILYVPLDKPEIVVSIVDAFAKLQISMALRTNSDSSRQLIWAKGQCWNTIISSTIGTLKNVTEFLTPCMKRET